MYSRAGGVRFFISRQPGTEEGILIRTSCLARCEAGRRRSVAFLVADDAAMGSLQQAFRHRNIDVAGEGLETASRPRSLGCIDALLVDSKTQVITAVLSWRTSGPT